MRRLTGTGAPGERRETPRRGMAEGVRAALVVALASMGLFGMTACGGSEPVRGGSEPVSDGTEPVSGSSDPIIGIDWHLESDRAANFRIEGTDLNGTDSCNRIFGQVRLPESDPPAIEFGELASTRMACPDHLDAQEDMRVALEGRRVVERPDDRTLVLVNEATGDSWRFVK